MWCDQCPICIMIISSPLLGVLRQCIHEIMVSVVLKSATDSLHHKAEIYMPIFKIIWYNNGACWKTVFFFNLHRFNWSSIEYLHWMWLIFQIKAKRRGSHRCGPRPACEGPNVGQTLSNRELKQWKQRAHPRDQGRPDCRPQAGPLIMTMASWIYVQEEYLALIHWNRNCLHSQRW